MSVTDVVGARDRARGTLLGLAAGNAVGTTVEFRRPGSFEPLVDLTRDDDRLAPYAAAWEALGAVRGRRLERIHHPIPDRGPRPGRDPRRAAPRRIPRSPAGRAHRRG